MSGVGPGGVASGAGDGAAAAAGGAAASATSPFAAIVLAGGRGSRLGGQDKAALSLAGERLVDRAVRAARGAGAASIVVVGPQGAVPAGCIAAREEPAFGGPLAALAAGVSALDAALSAVSDPDAPSSGDSGQAWILLLSCDLVDPDAAIAALIAAAPTAAEDAVVLRDPDGRAQWLAGCYRRASLGSALREFGGAVDGLPLRAALAKLATRFADADRSVIADIDTPADLARARGEVHAHQPDHPHVAPLRRNP